MKVNFKCFIKGHNPVESHYFEVCSRCGCDEYVDGIENEWCGGVNYWYLTIPALYKRRGVLVKLMYWGIRSKFFTKCYHCKKVNSVLGKQIGKHDDCLIF